MPDFADTSDFMAKSTTLRRHGSDRTFFDPTNAAHVASLKSYLEHGVWTVQFFCEDPFIDVPMTVFRKYIGHQLGVLVTTQEKLDAGVLVAQYKKLLAPSQEEMEAAEAAQRSE